MIQFVMTDPQGTILREIEDASTSRDDVAWVYASCIRQGDVDFGVVNAAILERWSAHALRYIKGKAWRIAEGRR